MRFLAGAVAVLAACGGVEAGSDGAPGDDQPPPTGDCTADVPGESGQATYYDADGTGNCSFDASSDFLVAAMNASDYGTADWCGGCVDVTGPDGHVVVRIVDKCPGCAAGDLDLSETAFGMIAPLSAGRVDITWQEVACPVDGPVSYHFQDGSSQFYTAVQVRDHKYPLVKLEVVDAGGAATEISRVDYNYFVATDGLGTGPYTFRVTDDRGQTIEDSGVELAPDGTRAGSAQFATCE